MKKVILFFVFSLFGFAAIPQTISLAKFNDSSKGNKVLPLEAVLVVGNSDESTKSAIEEMNSLALVFMKNGVKVTKFYDENTNWEWYNSFFKKIIHNRHNLSKTKINLLLIYQTNNNLHNILLNLTLNY